MFNSIEHQLNASDLILCRGSLYPTMTLIVIRDRNPNLKEAQTVANALCATGILQRQSGEMPDREVNDCGGSLEISCGASSWLLVKAGFVAAGFTVLNSGRPQRESDCKS
jgi:hypothetical protein